MFKKQKQPYRSKHGASLIEYIVLGMIILSGLYIMQQSILHGLFGHYRSSADSFAFSRQYDAKRSTVCKMDVVNYTIEGQPDKVYLYDEDCYNSKVRGPGGCPQCYPGDRACADCEDLIKNTICQNAYCKQ